MAIWKTEKLGKLVLFSSGGTPSKQNDSYWNGDIPWISAKTMKSDRISTSDLFITEEGLTKGSKLANAGTLLLLVRGSGLFNGIPVCYVESPVAYNQDVKCINSCSEVENEYIYYWLKANSDYLQAKLDVTGIGAGKFDTKFLAELDVAYPEKETRRKIIDFANNLTDKLQVNESINRNLLEQATILFKSWFIDYEPFGGEMPDDWKEGILDDIIEFSNGYAFKGKELLDKPDPERDCYHVFKQGHINRGGGFNVQGTKSWYPKELAEKLDKYVLKKGDVLMAMTDMKDNVAILGNTAVMEVDGEYIVNQRVGLLRPTGIYGIEYPYISLLTNGFEFLKDLRSRANSGVQVNLSSNEIRNSVINIAPEDINKDFNRLVMPLFEMMIKNDIENLKLSDLRDTLLPKLMSGELDISDLDF